MKLEKREITLNEADSLSDVFYTEKNLMLHYVHALEWIQSKESKNTLLTFLKEIGEDGYFIRDLMKRSLEENGE